jgi:Zn-dependent membrane protease YugP
MLLGILLFVATMAISLIATARVKSAYRRYSQVATSSGYSGAEAAAQILHAAGIHDVEIVEHDEMLGDHYDPMNKRLVLSTDNFHGNSVAALGIAAHECGHAIQHRIAYAPLHWRMAAVQATTFASQIVMWLPIIGMFTGLIRGETGLMIMAAAWGVIMLFNLVTLPVEFDATRRAKLILGEMNFISPGEEAIGVRRVLDAAGWTYVAAFITSLAYFLWHLLPLLLGRRDD